jgi:isopenicillin N synthase-like dioxygenase
LREKNDQLKVSYYALVPDVPENKWPSEVDLRKPFQDLATLFAEMSTSVMNTVGLLSSDTTLSSDKFHYIGRMLHYRSNAESTEGEGNPFWCGAHYDHSCFTTLMPASYFVDGQQIPEPKEAGLFVRGAEDTVFRKVVADDPDVMLFQVGEFAQLATNDEVQATEHRVHKASGKIERYALAVFSGVSMDTVVNSTSILTKDARYAGNAGEPCTFGQWNKASLQRYIVEQASEDEALSTSLN